MYDTLMKSQSSLDQTHQVPSETETNRYNLQRIPTQPGILINHRTQVGLNLVQSRSYDVHTRGLWIRKTKISWDCIYLISTSSWISHRICHNEVSFSRWWFRFVTDTTPGRENANFGHRRISIPEMLTRIKYPEHRIAVHWYRDVISVRKIVKIINLHWHTIAQILCQTKLSRATPYCWLFTVSTLIFCAKTHQDET